MVTAGMLTGCAGQGEDTVSSQAVTQEETQPVQEEVVNKEEKAEEYGVIRQRPLLCSKGIYRCIFRGEETTTGENQVSYYQWTIQYSCRGTTSVIRYESLCRDT